mgnify:CR=1 FL=1
MAAVFSVAAVLFSWHAGGGFATGNQANQYFLVSGKLGLVSALLALLLLTMTVRQAIVMYNSRRLGSYKELLETLYHPLDKLELVFEIYYYIMVLMCVSSCIAGAATLLGDALGVSYGLGIVLIGALLLVLSMFGAGVLRKVSSVLSLLILIHCRHRKKIGCDCGGPPRTGRHGNASGSNLPLVPVRGLPVLVDPDDDRLRYGAEK